MKFLNEIFALPIGLRVVAKIEGQEHFGSDTLNRSFIEAIKESQSSKKVYDIIEKLVNNQVITPVFSNKGMIGYLRKKLLQQEKYEIALGVFYDNEKKIYIFIDNNTNIFSYINNDSLAKLTIHEMIHLYSSLNKNKFTKVFEPELLKYYNSLFKLVFRINSKASKNVKDIFNFMFYNIERRANGIIPLKKLYDKLIGLKKYSNLDKKIINSKANNYVETVYNYYTNNLEKIYSDNNLINIYKSAIFAYKKAFGFYPTNKGCLQELVIPSEVICTISTYNPGDKIYSALRELK